MTYGEPIELSDLPRTARGRKVVPPEAVSEALVALQAGQAWKSSETFPNYSLARHAALRMRKAVLDVTFKDGLVPSTTVWEEDGGLWRFLITLR